MLKMARRSVTAALILNQAWQNSLNRTFVRTPILNSRCGYRIIRYFCSEEERLTGMIVFMIKMYRRNSTQENMQELPPGSKVHFKHDDCLKIKILYFLLQELLVFEIKDYECK
ncbi:hypothetical protein Hanom_Chr07g00620481 [Helianthus anomalus]